jgi:hypothetical protein
VGIITVDETTFARLYRTAELLAILHADPFEVHPVEARDGRRRWDLGPSGG